MPSADAWRGTSGQPLRVNVLGRGLAAGSVADLALSTSLLARFRAARHGQPIKEARKGGV
jgi:hypothetical protein